MCPGDGFYQEDTLETADGPKSKQKVLQKVPPEVSSILAHSQAT